MGVKLINIFTKVMRVWNPIKFGFMKTVLSKARYEKWLLEGLNVDERTERDIIVIGAIGLIMKHYKRELTESKAIRAYQAIIMGEAEPNDWSLWNDYVQLTIKDDVSPVFDMLIRDGDVTQNMISFFGSCRNMSRFPETESNEET